MASDRDVRHRIQDLNARIERLRGELSAAEREREALWAEVEAQLPAAPSSETGRVKRAAMESAPIPTVRTRELRIRQYVDKCRTLNQPWVPLEAARLANIPLRTARGHISDAEKMGLVDCFQYGRYRVRPKSPRPSPPQGPQAVYGERDPPHACPRTPGEPGGRQRTHGHIPRARQHVPRATAHVSPAGTHATRSGLHTPRAGRRNQGLDLPVGWSGATAVVLVLVLVIVLVHVIVLVLVLVLETPALRERVRVRARLRARVR